MTDLITNKKYKHTMEQIDCGHLNKLVGNLSDPVQYQIPLNDKLHPLNLLLDSNILLRFTGTIHCIACSRSINKTFNQGYCFPCSQQLARCDMCILKPETCHFHLGTCREPDWGQTNCMQPHWVYLANSSGLKVGITRHANIPSRWIDQGASQALAIYQVQTRYQAGLVEVAIAKHISDKTNWRAMLKGVPDPIALAEKRDELYQTCQANIENVNAQFGAEVVSPINDDTLTKINYPVLEYPTKIASHNFDKNPEVGGKLLGIKGQYLILDTGVINIRKFSGYEIELLAG